MVRAIEYACFTNETFLAGGLGAAKCGGNSTACHGYCTDILGCDLSEIVTETDFISTIFDWQNLIFLLVIVAIMKVGITVFQQEYSRQTGLAKDAREWWGLATSEPAVLMCLSAYIFSISNITHSSITEFAPVERVYPHVGFDTQFEPSGMLARFANIGTSLLWASLGVVFMFVAQWNTRRYMVTGLRQGETLLEMVTEGIVGDNAAAQGSNVAAGVIEAGCVIASGIVASGAIAGAPSDQYFLDLVLSITFLLLSQGALLGLMKTFDAFYITGTVGLHTVRNLETMRD
eukprot:COSAG05_NODE_2007_length_3714_cov_6.483084_1_plen_289_part_00